MALVASMAPGDVAWADEASPAPAPVDVVAVQEPGPDGLVPLDGEVTRPDWMSASVTARASQRRVEVLSERSETRRVWVHPDGHVQEEVAAAPVRFKDASATATDGWRMIDTTLKATPAGAVPAAMPGAVRVGGDQVVSMTDAAGDGAAVSLDGVSLGAPVVDGSVATYRDVVPGVDVRVEVRPVGFELVWVVKSRKGMSEAVRRWGRAGQVVFPAMIAGAGDTVPVAGKDGSVELVDASSRKPRGRLAAPQMWDAGAGKHADRGASMAAGFRLGAVKRVGKVSRASLGVVGLRPGSWTRWCLITLRLAA